MFPAAQMRLRITRQLYESIDGIQFSAFRCGHVYQVGPTIANYLLAVGAAEPAADDETGVSDASEEKLVYPHSNPDARSRIAAFATDRATAADRPQRNRRMKCTADDVSARVNALAAELKRIKRHLLALRHAS